MRIHCSVPGTVVSLLSAAGLVLFFGGAEIARAQQPKTVDTKSTVPKPAQDLHAGRWSYKGWVEAEGKRTDFTATRTIKKQGDTWIVIDGNEQPSGEGTDETTLAKGSLVVRKRSVVQGPFKMDYVVKDGKAMGKMQIG